jgi:hypothetical protein
MGVMVLESNIRVVGVIYHMGEIYNLQFKNI